MTEQDQDPSEPSQPGLTGKPTAKVPLKLPDHIPTQQKCATDGCPWFGSTASNNLCSSCYTRDMMGVQKVVYMPPDKRKLRDNEKVSAAMMAKRAQPFELAPCHSIWGQEDGDSCRIVRAMGTYAQLQTMNPEDSLACDILGDDRGKALLATVLDYHLDWLAIFFWMVASFFGIATSIGLVQKKWVFMCILGWAYPIKQFVFANKNIWRAAVGGFENVFLSLMCTCWCVGMCDVFKWDERVVFILFYWISVLVTTSSDACHIAFTKYRLLMLSMHIIVNFVMFVAASSEKSLYDNQNNIIRINVYQTMRMTLKMQPFAARSMLTVTIFYCRYIGVLRSNVQKLTMVRSRLQMKLVSFLQLRAILEDLPNVEAIPVFGTHIRREGVTEVDRSSKLKAVSTVYRRRSQQVAMKPSRSNSRVISRNQSVRKKDSRGQSVVGKDSRGQSVVGKDSGGQKVSRKASRKTTGEEAPPDSAVTPVDGKIYPVTAPSAESSSARGRPIGALSSHEKESRASARGRPVGALSSRDVHSAEPANTKESVRGRAVGSMSSREIVSADKEEEVVEAVDPTAPVYADMNKIERGRTRLDLDGEDKRRMALLTQATCSLLTMRPEEVISIVHLAETWDGVQIIDIRDTVFAEFLGVERAATLFMIFKRTAFTPFLLVLFMTAMIVSMCALVGAIHPSNCYICFPALIFVVNLIGFSNYQLVKQLFFYSFDTPYLLILSTLWTLAMGQVFPDERRMAFIFYVTSLAGGLSADANHPGAQKYRTVGFVVGLGLLILVLLGCSWGACPGAFNKEIDLTLTPHLDFKLETFTFANRCSITVIIFFTRFLYNSYKAPNSFVVLKAHVVKREVTKEALLEIFASHPVETKIRVFGRKQDPEILAQYNDDFPPPRII